MGITSLCLDLPCDKKRLYSGPDRSGNNPGKAKKIGYHPTPIRMVIVVKLRVELSAIYKLILAFDNLDWAFIRHRQILKAGRHLF
jgi:hypothetical protein